MQAVFKNPRHGLATGAFFPYNIAIHLKEERIMGRPAYKKGSSTVSVVLLAIGLGLSFTAVTSVLFFLIASSDLLPRWLYVVLEVLYFLVLAIVGGCLYRRIDLRRERAQLGDEVFFEMYPREWKREIKRRKRMGLEISDETRPGSV